MNESTYRHSAGKTLSDRARLTVPSSTALPVCHNDSVSVVTKLAHEVKLVDSSVDERRLCKPAAVIIRIHLFLYFSSDVFRALIVNDIEATFL